MRGLFSVLLGLLFVDAPSTAAIFDADDRVAITAPDDGLQPIGVVLGGKHVAHATGFLVSACHVLTVKHAAGRVASVAGRRMRFRLPLAGREGESAGSVIAAGALDLVNDANRLERSGDWLLLRLDRCLGDRFGYLTLDGSDQSAPVRIRAAALSSAGFPIDRDWRRALTLDPECRVRGVTGTLMVHDCSSLPGNSGSPILKQVSRNGRPVLEVVAMHSTALVSRKVLRFRGEDASVATRIADVLPTIRAYLPTDRRSETALAAR